MFESEKLTNHHRWFLYSARYKNLPLSSIPPEDQNILIDTGMIKYDQNREQFVLTREGNKLVDEGVAIIYPLVPNNTAQGFSHTINSMTSAAMTTFINTMSNLSNVIAGKVRPRIIYRLIYNLLCKVITKLSPNDIIQLRELIQSFSDDKKEEKINPLLNNNEELNITFKILNKNIIILKVKGNQIVYKKSDSDDEEVSTFEELGITMADVIKSAFKPVTE